MPLKLLIFLTTKKFDLVRPRYLSNANVFENLWLNWSHFLRKEKEGTQPSTVPPVCYIAVDGSKEKDSVKGKSSHPDVFCKKVSLKIFQYTKGNTCVGVSSKYNYRSSACNFIKKETVVQMFSCEFCLTFMTQFLSKSPNEYFLKSTGFH